MRIRSRPRSCTATTSKSEGCNGGPSGRSACRGSQRAPCAATRKTTDLASNRFKAAVIAASGAWFDGMTVSPRTASMAVGSERRVELLDQVPTHVDPGDRGPTVRQNDGVIAEGLDRTGPALHRELEHVAPLRLVFGDEMQVVPHVADALDVGWSPEADDRPG